MSPLGYDPEEKVNTGPSKPGSYEFNVAQAEETEFRSGNQGLKVTLEVFADGDEPRSVYDNFVYVPKALWKLEQFLICIGLDFNNQPEEEELLGRSGVAYFELGEPNDAGRQYLQAGEFFPQGTTAVGPDKDGGPGNLPPAKAKAKAQPPQGSAPANTEEDPADDIPF